MPLLRRPPLTWRCPEPCSASNVSANDELGRTWTSRPRERYRRSREGFSAPPLSNDPFLNSLLFGRANATCLLSLVGDRELRRPRDRPSPPPASGRARRGGRRGRNSMSTPRRPASSSAQGLVQGCWDPLPRKENSSSPLCAHQHAERASRYDAREIALVNDRRHRLPSSFLDVRRRLTGPSSTARPERPRHAATDHGGPAAVVGCLLILRNASRCSPAIPVNLLEDITIARLFIRRTQILEAAR